MQLFGTEALDDASRRIGTAAQIVQDDADRVARALRGLDWSSPAASAVLGVIGTVVSTAQARAIELIQLAGDIRRQAAEAERVKTALEHFAGDVTGHLISAAGAGLHDASGVISAVGDRL